MQSKVLPYTTIASLITLKFPSTQHVEKQRELIKNGRLVIEGDEYRLTAVRRLASQAHRLPADKCAVCGSTRLDDPDHENARDCLDCGVFTFAKDE